MEYDDSVLETGQIRNIGNEPCLIFEIDGVYRNLILTAPIRMGGIYGSTLRHHPIVTMLPPAPRLDEL